MTCPDARERFAECSALCDHGPLLTAEEKAAFKASKARQAAEDERQRHPEPQLQLPEAD